MAVACHACGETLPEAARFCPACGRPAPSEHGEMLKLVTVLFADVVSSTAHADALDPEETRAVLGGVFSAMALEIHAEGGAVEKYIGDAIMAVFGVPIAHEDDALRAVRAARRMLARLDGWNAANDGEIRIRIGINTGDVLASGAAGRDLLVTGDAVNVASRLEHEAPQGSILIGERTAQAVRREFELTPLGPLDIRGKSEPIPAWLVERERELPEPEGVAGLMSPMVGRDVELGLLQTLFDRAKNEAAPQLVTIIGDAGIGKSRLTREFCNSLGNDAELLLGRCLPYGDGVTLWPLGEILKSRGGILETDPPDMAYAKIEALVAEAMHPDLAPDPARAAAGLASTMGLLRPDRPDLAEHNPREAQHELRGAWRAFIASLAGRRPLVVVIEDIHWADAAMLATVEDLASHVDGPVLFVTTARQEALHARPDWGGGLPNYSALRLNPLPWEASTAMLTHMLELEELPIAASVLEKAEGNPFFLEEILRGLVDSNRLRLEDGRLRATNGFGEVVIPDTVQAVILARIDLLDVDEKRALQLAAVIGRTFWRGAVARVLGRDDVDDMLHVLQRRGLVRERLTSSVGDEVEYTFRHVLIQEVAYESVPRRERARAHAQAAHWMEATAGPRRDELAELLAHHYVTAHSIIADDELRWAARAYCLTAAQSAFRRFAIEQAEMFAWLAVDLSLPGSERVDAVEALGDLYAVTMRGDAAWKAYTDALLEVQAAEPVDNEAVARLAARATSVFTRRGATMVDGPSREDVGRIVDLGLAAAGEGATRERTELLAAKSYVIALSPKWGAAFDVAGEQSAQAAIALAEEIGDPNLISAAIDVAEMRLKTLGLFGQIRERNRRRIELVPSLTDSSEICDAHVVGAWSAVMVGHYGEASEHATRCIEVAAGVDEGQYVHGLVWRIAAEFRAGEWDSAIADHAEIDRHFREAVGGSPPPLAAHAYSTMFLCHRLRGNEDAARSCEEIARGLNDQVEAGRGLNSSRAMMARALTHAGRLDEAEALLTQMRGRERMFFDEALTDLLVARGDWKKAARTAAALRADAPRTGELSLPLLADRLDGRVAAARGDLGAAETLLRSAADGFDDVGAPWEAARERAALGALLGDDAELERAVAEFERLGAVVDAAASRDRRAPTVT